MTTKDEKKLNEVYAERNRLALTLARLAHALGHNAYFGEDRENGPDWCILFIETPAGQVSWHIPWGEIPDDDPVPLSFIAKWDGHTKAQANRRLEKWNLWISVKQYDREKHGEKVLVHDKDGYMCAAYKRGKVWIEDKDGLTGEVKPVAFMLMPRRPSRPTSISRGGWT